MSSYFRDLPHIVSYIDKFNDDFIAKVNKAKTLSLIYLCIRQHYEEVRDFPLVDSNDNSFMLKEVTTKYRLLLESEQRMKEWTVNAMMRIKESKAQLLVVGFSFASIIQQGDA